MRIALNTLSVQSGAGVVFLNILLPRLLSIDQKNHYVIFYSFLQKEYIDLLPSGFEKIFVRSVPRNPFLRVLWEQVVFPIYLFRYRIDVLYSIGNTTSIFAPCKIVLLIENANPYSKLGLPWSRKERFRFSLLRFLGFLSARRASRVRFVSQDSYNRIFPRLSIHPGKCIVIPHGVFIPVSSFEYPLLLKQKEYPHDSPGNYILTIGANALHRNITRLVQAFSLLVQCYHYDGDLVVVGVISSEEDRLNLKEIMHVLGLENRVIFTGEVPHHEIYSYLAHTELFVFPSIEETFGIPLIEAMALGVPIATSDCNLDISYRGRCFNPFREICGDAVEYFNPFDVDNIAESMNDMLINSSKRHEYVKKGIGRVKQYDIDTTACALVQLFEDVVKRRSPH